LTFDGSVVELEVPQPHK